MREDGAINIGERCFWGNFLSIEIIKFRSMKIK